MHNNFHPKHRKHAVNSVDGMTASGSGLRPISARSQSTNKDPQSAFGSRPQLNSFRATDGFVGAQQPKMDAPFQKRVPTLASNTGRQPRRNAHGMIDLSLSPGPKKPKKAGWRIRSKRTFIGVSVFVIMIGGFLFGKGFWSLSKILQGGGGAAALQDNVDPTRLRGEGDGRVNILLLGKGGPGHEAPDLTDTLLIASIDPINKKAALLSIPRDLWVEAEGMGGMKINAVYANAKNQASYAGQNQKSSINSGLNAVQKVIEKNIGIPVHYHAMVDFTAFRKAIDTVGGIDLNIDANGVVYEVLWDGHTGSHYTLNVQQGQQHFNGTRALFYSRSRYTSPRGDFDRTERQRKVLLALKDKVLSAGTYANPAKISQLLSDFGNHVVTDFNGTDDLMRLYDISKEIQSSNVVSVGLADPPNNYVTTGNVGGQSVVLPRAGIGNFTEIQRYVRNALKDGFIAKENAKIVVLNGTTTPGLATAKSEELKSFGYDVIKVGDAPTKNYSSTRLIDLRGGVNKYTRHYLEKRLGVTASSSLPNGITPGEADFVIILGTK